MNIDPRDLPRTALDILPRAFGPSRWRCPTNGRRFAVPTAPEYAGTFHLPVRFVLR